MPFNVEPLDEKDYLIDVDTEDLPGKKEPEPKTEETTEKVEQLKKPAQKQETKPTSTTPAKTNKENDDLEYEPTDVDTDSPFLDEENVDENGNLIEKQEESKKVPAPKQETPEDKNKQKAKKVDLKEGIDFSAYAQGLIEEGIWYPLQDNEGNVIPTEELGLDQKSFIELAKQQAEWKAEDVLKERESEYGEQYQELVSHIKNKGNIQDLLQNYQEQKDIEQMDTSNLEQAEEVLRTYLDSVNWDKSDIDDFVNTAKDKGEDHLKAVAEKRKTDLVNSIKEDREQIKQAQTVQYTRQRQAQETFDKKVRESIYKSEMPERDKKKLDRFMYEYKHPLEGGGKATDMYIKLQEFRSNPDLWTKLASFLENPDNYGEKSKIEDKVKSGLFRMFQESKFNNKSKDTKMPNRMKVEDEDNPKAPNTFKKAFGGN